MSETKTNILAATDDLMSIRGVNAVSLDEIAQHAGCTKRTIYYHFKDKSALVAAWLEQRSVDTSAIENPALKPSEAILAIFDALVAHLEKQSFRGCPFVLSSAELFGQDHPAVPVARSHKRKRREWFETQCMALGDPDAKSHAQEFMVIWEGAWASSLVLQEVSAAHAARRAAESILQKIVDAQAIED